VNAWLGASRLSLNPGKTQVMWLGSKHLVGDIAITEVPVMTSSVAMVDSARDLGVVIDKCLTMSGFVSATCRASWNRLEAKGVCIWRIMTSPVVPLERGYCSDSAER